MKISWSPALYTSLEASDTNSYLLQLFLGIFLAAPLILSTLPQLLQPLSFLLGNIDLITQLLLQMDLLYFHCAVLLLGLMEPGGWVG